MHLPSYDYAQARTEAGYGTALDRFICQNEPSGKAAEQAFREGLAEALIEAACPLDRSMTVVEAANAVLVYAQRVLRPGEKLTRRALILGHSGVLVEVNITAFVVTPAEGL